MKPFNLPTFLRRCQALVDECSLWATRAREWAQIALTGVGIVQVPAGTKELYLGREEHSFRYYVVNDDLNTVTIFLVSDPVPGTSFQIRNNGHGIVQVQGMNGGVVNSPGTLILRGNGSVVSLVALRADNGGIPAMWDLIGDVQPL